MATSSLPPTFLYGHPPSIRPRCEGERSLGLHRCECAVAAHLALALSSKFHSFPCLEAGETGVTDLLVPLLATLTLLPT
jgi:hypothetical protein